MAAHHVARCVHTGISVEVEHKDFGTFKHQIPTGPIVLVSSVNPNWTGTPCAYSYARSLACMSCVRVHVCVRACLV
jgi:hypothetical protein